jgi:NAD(P)-dependent dehydrogenase (short-subunit alcohol dehydrogenase family)
MVIKNTKKDKTVLITGAAGGLGSALVKLFAEAGFRVIATDTDIMRLSGQDKGYDIIGKALDVTEPEQVKMIVNEMALDQTGLDILICAAGIYESFPVTEADPVLFKKIMAVNLLGTDNMVSNLLKPLVKSGGRVIVVSSESYKVQAMFQPYMVSKASLEAYCNCARQELALKGVKLSVIRPGAMNTPLLNWMKSAEFIERYPVYKKELMKSWKRSVKMVGKIVSPEMVAQKIFIAANETNPKRIYRVNNSRLVFFVSLLPKCFLDWMMIKMFRIKP